MKKEMSMIIRIDEELCKGCALCIDFCPSQALEKSKTLNKRGVYHPMLADESKCNRCRFCELICPDFAITVVPEGNDSNSSKKEVKVEKLRVGNLK